MKVEVCTPPAMVVVVTLEMTINEATRLRDMLGKLSGPEGMDTYSLFRRLDEHLKELIRR